MYGGPIDFNWMEHSLDNKDINDSHRWNYLRHKLVEREKRAKEYRELIKEF